MPMKNADYYKLCNLQMNPFRSNATLEDDPRMGVWAGHENEQRQLQKFLARSRAEQVGNASLLLLYGDYGNGKSHAMLWGTHWLNSLTENGRSAAYYIPTLKRDKGKFSFAGALRDDLVAKTSLIEDIRQYRQFLQRALTKFVSDNNVGTDVGTDQLIERVIPAVELYNFAKELNRRETPDEIVELIAGNKISDYQAMTNFSRIVNLFVYEVHHADKTERFRQSVHLMIDELDSLKTAPSKDVLEVSDLIRHLYDMCPNCFGLVLAMSAEQDVIPTILAEAVLTRVTKQIEFAPYDRAAAVDFVIHIMDHMRVDKTNRKQIGSYPFTKDALDALIGQLTSKTPRRVVDIMQAVLEEIRLADLDPTKAIIGVRELDQKGIMDELG